MVELILLIIAELDNGASDLYMAHKKAERYILYSSLCF